MRRALAIAGSAVFLVIAPGVVDGWAPWWISHWRVEAPIFGLKLFRFAGAILLAPAIVGLLDSFGRFAFQGLGTPAPPSPTRRLVVTGLYRYVRNPMYLSVVMAIFGQGLIFGSVTLLAYGGLVWLLSHLFVLVYEEPELRRVYPSEYRLFCAAVPRWIPRLTAGTGRGKA